MSKRKKVKQGGKAEAAVLSPGEEKLKLAYRQFKARQETFDKADTLRKSAKEELGLAQIELNRAAAELIGDAGPLFDQGDDADAADGGLASPDSGATESGQDAN